ncbi:MAG: fumarate hydratase, partial [Clostridia bacterium]|nr:fumarate hydratase [Clostridia bacterium]
MREISVDIITCAISSMFIEASHYLGDDVKNCLKTCGEREDSQLARSVFESIEKNIEIAEEGVFPLCQDTGMACVFMEIGQ